MSSDKGYIKLYRDIRDHWTWNSGEPFSYGQAWVDLIISANHEERKIRFNGKIVTVKRGEFITSIQKLSKRWKWSANKVRRFLDLLFSDNMIRQTRNTHGTTINIVNYGLYQSSDANKRNTVGTRSEHERNTDGNKQGTIEDTIEDTKKKNPQTPFSDQADEKQKMEELYPAEEGWYDP